MIRRITDVHAVGTGASAILAILKGLCKHATVYTANLTQGEYRLISQHPRGIMKNTPKA